MSDNERIARGSVLSIISELDSRDAEIERLRVALEYDKTLFREGGIQRKRDLAEIERLRADLSKWKARAQVMRDAWRQTDWAQWISYDHPEARDWFDGIAREGDAGDAMAAAVKEIERLRALLREVFDGLDDYWIKLPEGVSWILRVSDALGDEELSK